MDEESLTDDICAICLLELGSSGYMLSCHHGICLNCLKHVLHEGFEDLECEVCGKPVINWFVFKPKYMHQILLQCENKEEVTCTILPCHFEISVKELLHRLSRGLVCECIGRNKHATDVVFNLRHLQPLLYHCNFIITTRLNQITSGNNFPEYHDAQDGGALNRYFYYSDAGTFYFNESNCEQPNLLFRNNEVNDKLSSSEEEPEPSGLFQESHNHQIHTQGAAFDQDGATCDQDGATCDQDGATCDQENIRSQHQSEYSLREQPNLLFRNNEVNDEMSSSEEEPEPSALVQESHNHQIHTQDNTVQLTRFGQWIPLLKQSWEQLYSLRTSRRSVGVQPRQEHI